MEPSITEEMKALHRELADIELRVACREADTIDRLRMDLDIARSENSRLRAELAVKGTSPSPRSSSRDRPSPSVEDTTSPRSDDASESRTIESKNRVIATLEAALTELRTELVRTKAARDEELQRLQDDLACRDDMLAALQDQLSHLQKMVNDLTAAQSVVPPEATPAIAPTGSVHCSNISEWISDAASHVDHDAASFLRPGNCNRRQEPRGGCDDGTSTTGRKSTILSSRVSITTLEALSRLWDDISVAERKTSIVKRQSAAHRRPGSSLAGHADERHARKPLNGSARSTASLHLKPVNIASARLKPQYAEIVAPLVGSNKSLRSVTTRRNHIE